MAGTEFSNEMIPHSISEATTEPIGCPRNARRADFVAAAQDAFFTYGYAGTAMSQIAAKVGGSKTTLWSHFPSKQDLFVAVVDDLVERYGAALEVPLDPATPLRAALRQFADAMMAIVQSEPIVALNRLVIGEAGRFPELGALFFARGPARGKGKLAAYLKVAMENNCVRRGDPAVAARQFASLCQAGCHQMRLVGGSEVDKVELEADIVAAIDTFVRAWEVPA